MFYTLLLVTFTLSVLVSWFVARIFSNPAALILRRIIQDDVCQSWSRYLMFAIYVVGISAGVRITELERYVTAPVLPRGGGIVELTTERWVVEVYRTIIGTLQGLAWVLLIFFAFTLLAFVIVRVFETRRPKA
jgi:hypothetical protein